MEIQIEERMDARRKKRIRLAAGIFAGLLIILTLFSNTIMTMKLPKVRTEQPQDGQSTQTIKGSGVLQPKQSVRMTNPAGWRVKKVYVKKGDKVKKGQVVATFDTSAAARSIEDEQDRLAQLRLTLQQTQDQFISSQREGDELALRQVKRDMENARLSIDVQEHRIQSLQEELERGREIKAPFSGMILEANDPEGLTGEAGEVVAIVSNRSKGFQFSFSVSSDLASLLKIGETLSLDIKGGEVPKAEGRIVEIGESTGGTADASSAAGSASAGSDAAAEGSDAQASANAAFQRRVVVSVHDAGLKGGEEAKVLVEKPAEQESVLISNAAIHEDRLGKYVFVLKESRGPLGNTYIVRKTAVTTGGSNGKETAILQGLTIADLAIVESGEPLQEGDRVRIQ